MSKMTATPSPLNMPAQHFQAPFFKWDNLTWYDLTYLKFTFSWLIKKSEQICKNKNYCFLILPIKIWRQIIKLRKFLTVRRFKWCNSAVIADWIEGELRSYSVICTTFIMHCKNQIKQTSIWAMAGLFAFNSKNNLHKLISIYVYYTSDCRNNLKKKIF